MTKGQAITICVLALVIGVGGGIDLYRHMPFGQSSSYWSVWIFLTYMCFMITIYAGGNLMDIARPGWERIDDE